MYKNGMLKTGRIMFVVLLLLPIDLFGKEYKGGELRTIQTCKYGRFEARIKASSGSGQLCSFFTYYDGGGTTNWNEIDIEILGRYTDDVQFNAITPGESHHVSHYPVVSDVQADFHTYAFEWTPEYVAWFVDGLEAQRQTGDHISTLTNRQKIMMNIWPPAYSDWAGELDPEILPVFAAYDWVSYASYTPGEGSAGTDNNFTPLWTDHFDAWDQNRWAKATHTFGGNDCDFIPENVVFIDGYMILCLTDSEHPGCVDDAPPILLGARASGEGIVVLFSEALDRQSAESISHYILVPSATIEQATLREDGRSVQLTVPDLDKSGVDKLIVQGVGDDAVPPNTMPIQHCDVFSPEAITFPLRVNVGGNAYNDFLADQAWSEAVAYGYCGGGKTNYSQYLPIAGTEDDDIYRNELWGLISYKIRGPSGQYDVTFMMAENYFSEPGRRVFDLFVEGEKVAEDLDIYREVGKSAAYTMTIEDIAVTDGIVDIHFSAAVDQPLLNGLIVSYGGCSGAAGDVNGDGTINFVDLITAVNHILGTDLLDECEYVRADVTHDSVINVLDLVAIVNIILGGS